MSSINLQWRQVSESFILRHVAIHVIHWEQPLNDIIEVSLENFTFSQSPTEHILIIHMNSLLLLQITDLHVYIIVKGCLNSWLGLV